MLFPSCFKQLCLYGRVWAQQKGNCPCKWLLMALGLLLSEREWPRARCHQGWPWDQAQGSCSLWPPNPPAAGFLWRGHSCCSLCSLECSGQAEDKVPPPSGALVGLGGSEAVPISQYNPKARSLQIWPPKGIFHPSGCLHLKAALPESLLCVSWGTELVQRHWTALGVGVRAFPEGLRSDSCPIPKDGVAGQESV